VLKGYDYSRTRNPTRTALQDNLAALEGGKHGLCFSSGMGAINTVLNLLQAGDHVVAGNDLYGGTYRLCTKLYRKYGLEFSFIDLSDLGKVETALRPNTKLLMMETPSNPLLKLCDIAAIAGMCRGRGVLTMCDNTFATPFLQNPLALGCDIVTHSTTKYLGGHSDVVGGALITNDDGLAEQLAFFQNSVGATPGPLDCFLVLRGTKTLHVRMERHCRNAQAIAEHLARDRRVSRVYYPGLPSHPQYELAKRQMRLPGGMVSFEVRGSVEDAKRVASSFRLFALAESLGGVESLVDHPATMTHGSIPAEERRAAGFADGLIRLSVGIEDEVDLREDLDRALSALDR
ncbi:MAG TPA: PLP-dependent aspartate aminotransferase family protein, partial [Planctomycetota bacterium]|nr:PLP-dependent aspartate aminotransferase family protein [Planctomycetota bacterium]